MNDNVGHYMSRDYDCRKQARLLMDGDEYTGVRNRAYYAYFDLVRALLARSDIPTRSHSAAHHLFSQDFVKEGPFDKQDAKALAKLFDMRQNSDYDAEPDVNANNAQYAIDITAEFLLQVEAYLRDNGFNKPTI